MNKKKEADEISDKVNVLLDEKDLDEEKINNILGLLKQALKLHKDAKDEEGMAMNCGTIGNIYGALGEFEKALVYYEKSLKLFEKIGHENGRIITYGNMVTLYGIKGKIGKALECALKMEKIASDIGINLSWENEKHMSYSVEKHSYI